PGSAHASAAPAICGNAAPLIPPAAPAAPDAAPEPAAPEAAPASPCASPVSAAAAPAPPSAPVAADPMPSSAGPARPPAAPIPPDNRDWPSVPPVSAVPAAEPSALPPAARAAAGSSEAPAVNGAATAPTVPSTAGRTADRKLYSGAPVIGLCEDCGEPATKCCGCAPAFCIACLIVASTFGVCTCGGTAISPGVRCAMIESPKRPICAISAAFMCICARPPGCAEAARPNIARLGFWPPGCGAPPAPGGAGRG